MYFYCAYLRTDVELTEERERHIIARHPDLLPDHRELIAEVIADPDLVRRSQRFASAKLLSRWYSEESGGKHVVAVVITDERMPRRAWIVTAYRTTRLSEGEIEWQRS